MVRWTRLPKNMPKVKRNKKIKKFESENFAVSNKSLKNIFNFSRVFYSKLSLEIIVIGLEL